MAKKTDRLSPHHVGEVLCAELLAVLGQSPSAVAMLPVFDPRDDTHKNLATVISVGAFEPRAGAPIEPGAGRRVDGMHDIDCALVTEKEVVAMELKLGTTGLTAADFKRRFVAGRSVPRIVGERIDGGVVGLLDWNGRSPPGFDAPLALHTSDRPVAPNWLLLVLQSTLDEWSRAPRLAHRLGTKQLVGVLTLESLASTSDRKFDPGYSRGLSAQA